MNRISVDQIHFYPSYLEINMRNIQNNVNIIHNSLPKNTQLIPVLKCNGYGCGMEEVALLLSKDPKIRCFAVAQVQEALTLREAGIQQDILVIGPAPTEDAVLACAEKSVSLPLYGMASFNLWARLLREHALSLYVHIAVNTGLNRLGFAPDEAHAVAVALRSHTDVFRICGTYTHCKDILGGIDATPQYKMLNRFADSLSENGIDPGLRHLCASALFEQQPEFAMDAVRIGRRLYYNAIGKHDSDIREAASWRAFIADIAERKAGSAVGYGEGCVLQRDSKVALIGIGYGD